MIYITPQGTPGRLDSAEDCAKAIRIGMLFSRSRVYDDSTGKWVEAMHHPELGSYFPPPPPEERPRHEAWLAPVSIVVWVACLVVPVSFTSWKGKDPMLVGMVAGGTFLGAIIGALVSLWVGRLTRASTGPRYGWVLGGIVFGLLEALVIPKYVEDRERLQASALTLQEAPRKVEDKGAGNASSSAAALPPTPPAHAPSAMKAQTLDAATEFIQQERRAGEKFRSTVDGIHIDALLSPKTLGNRKARQGVSERLDTWEQALTAYEGAHGQAVQNLMDHLRQPSLLDSPGVHRIRRMIELHRSLITQFRALYADLDRHPGAVKLSGGRLVFPGKGESKTFKSHLALIKETAYKLSQLEEAMKKHPEEAFAQVQEIARSAAVQQPPPTRASPSGRIGAGLQTEFPQGPAQVRRRTVTAQDQDHLPPNRPGLSPQ